jgi:hypothetical protein
MCIIIEPDSLKCVSPAVKLIRMYVPAGKEEEEES